MNDNMIVTIKGLNNNITQKFERVVSMNFCLKFSRFIYDDESFVDYTFKNLTGEQVAELVEYVIKNVHSTDYMEISIL